MSRLLFRKSAMDGTKTLTETSTSISRKGDSVTVTTVKTITTTKPGCKPEVKVEEKVEKYEGKDGFERMPAELRKELEESEKKKVDPKDIDFKATESDFEEELLEEVNKLRKVHHADPLKICSKASKYAKERAAEMAEKDEMVPRTDRNYGECVTAMYSNDPKHRVKHGDIAERWQEEGKTYDFTTEAATLKGGHFTQVVWKATKKFGAAAAKSNTNKIYVVAAFDPPGNFKGEFKDNVSAPKTSVGTFLKNFISKKDSDSSSSEDEDETDLVKFNKKGVDCHNKYRKKHGVSPVKYSGEIAKYAQEWAEKLARERKFEHRPASSRKYGENIYTARGIRKVARASDACDSWYSEIRDHTFGQEPKNMNTGHFTQVVWKSTSEIGMGRAKSLDGSWIIVANYNPPGNYIGQYTANVPKP